MATDDENIVQKVEQKVSKLSSKQKLIFAGVILGLLVIFCASMVLYGNYKDRKIEEKIKMITESEMREKQAVSEVAKYQLQKDTLKQQITKLDSVIEYNKNNPTIIVLNNDKAHMDINKLDAFNSIKLFEDNVEKYEKNRERYSLHRFLKK